MKNDNQEKTTLVVDGNWLMMGRQFMLREKFSISNSESVRNTATEELADLMIQSLCVCLRALGGVVTNVVFVSDGRSWRKDIPKPQCISETTYKGNRIKTSETDWNAVWKAITLLENRLRQFGMTVSVAPGVEGDDWCWWWSRRLNSQGTNVILWTIDEDVKQLVQRDKDTGAWTGWYERRPGLFLPAEMQPGYKDDDDIDFFMTPISSQSQASVILTKNLQVTYVNPSKIINKKIYVGDSGDNVLPTFTYTKGGKTYKATENDMGQVIDLMESAYTTAGWEDTLPDVYDKIIHVKGRKVNGAEVISKEDFIDHVKYNRRMVWLDESQIPQEIQEVMSRQEYTELPPDKMHDLRFNWKCVGREADQDLQSLFDDEDLPF